MAAINTSISRLAGRVGVTGFAAVLLLQPCAVAAGSQTELEVEVATGIDFSKGDYGDDQDTEITYLPVSVKFIYGEWSLRAATGYIYLDGPGTVISGGDLGPTPTPVRDRVVADEDGEAGLADTSVSVTYSPELDSESWYLDFTGKVKLPTADEDEGLGTGETDVTLQVDVSKLVGNYLPFATLGYRFVGDPQDFELEDTAYGSLGVAYYFRNDVNAGISYDYREAASPSAEDPQELFSYLNVGLDNNWRLIGYGTVGLSEGSPDFGVGVQIKYRGF